MAKLKKFEATFTQVANSWLKDKNISAKAKGVICVIQSLDDGWSFSVAGLATLFDDGENAIRGAIKELQDAGYLVWERCRNQDGTLGVTIVKTIEKPNVENPRVDKPNVDKQPQQIYNKQITNKQIKNNMDADASDSQIKSKLSKKPVNDNPLTKALYDCIREWKLPVRNHANLRKKLSEIKGLYSEELLIDYFSTLSENPFLFSKDEPFQPTVNDGVDLISKIVQIRRCAQKEMVDEGGNISLTKIWG